MIFTVANQKGGVGKTTFLITFANYLQQHQNKKVLVIDTDTQANCSYSLQDTNVLTDAYSLFTDSKEELLQKMSDIHDYEINLISSDVKLTDEEDFNKENYINNLKHLNSLFDFILIDSGPSVSNKLIYSLEVVDYAIVPVELEIYSLQGLGLMLNTIINIKNTTNNKLNLLGVLPSRVITTNKRQLINLERLIDEYGEDLFLPWIRFRNDIADATSNRMLFFKSKSKHKKELKEVYDNIYSRMQ